MAGNIDRRNWLKSAAALTAAGLAPARLRAQTPPTPGALPARGEFVVRNAIVLSIDERIGDFARGDVHVRNGAIIAVAKEIVAPGVASIDASGMICMQIGRAHV